VGESLPAEVAGAAELIVGHKDRDSMAPMFREWLRTDDEDLLRYLATLGLTAGPVIAEEVDEAARWETRPLRAAVFAEALESRRE
jgi:hypothetical protein